MKNTNKSPELTKQEYDRGMLATLELFQDLVAASKSYPLSRILAVLDENQSREFEAFVRSFASLRDDDEIIASKGKPTWGLAEIRKCINDFDGRMRGQST